MKVVKEITDFEDLYRNSWSGAIDTLKHIQIAGLESELLNLIEDVFYDSTPTETDLNDFLWFDREYIYENLGILED